MCVYSILFQLVPESNLNRHTTHTHSTPLNVVFQIRIRITITT